MIQRPIHPISHTSASKLLLVSPDNTFNPPSHLFVAVVTSVRCLAEFALAGRPTACDRLTGTRPTTVCHATVVGGTGTGGGHRSESEGRNNIRLLSRLICTT